MLIYAIIGVMVLVAGAAGVVIVALWQDDRLRNELRLEITNRGNVRSRYELSAKDPDDALAFRFTLDGDTLPQRHFVAVGETQEAGAVQPVFASQPGEKGAVQQKVAQTTAFGSAIANGLMSLGTLLPRSVGAPLTRVASGMQSGKMKVQQAQRVPTQVAQAKARVSPRRTAKAQPTPHAPAILSSTVETPYVGPAETLAVDLQVRATKPGRVRQYPFSISSRSVEQEDAPWVVEEGSATILAASGLVRYLPYLVVIVIAAVVLAAVILLASSSGLS